MPKKTPLLSAHKNFVLLLKKLKLKDRNNVIKQAAREQLNCISEIFSNFLKKHLTLNKKVIKKLRNYREDIRVIARKKTPLHKKRLVLTSRRGGNILAAILPIAASLIGKIFG